jgi:chromosome segregation ATPase
VGGLLFGKDLASYVKSSAKLTRTAVKDSVPIEFELKRAQDLLEEIIPEIHTNINRISNEEVEIAALKSDLNKSEKAFAEEKERIQKVRQTLAIQQASYTIGNRQYSREDLTKDLAWRFDRFKEAEIVLASKQRMLNTRENGLQAAMQMLERTKAQKELLASKIQSLESQHRLIRAASVGSGMKFDNSKLAQTEQLIGQIKKRLDVAERVLAHESNFVQGIPVDVLDETQLIQQIDDHFSGADKAKTDVETTEEVSTKLLVLEK